MAHLPKDAIIAILVDNNTEKHDNSTCSSGVDCANILCSQCPLERSTVSLGEVRGMDTRVTATEEPKVEPQDIEGVRTPSHYMLFDDIEAIEVIARSMTVEQFKGYILGTVLKYRLRAGKKSELAYMEKDLAKAAFFTELYELHKDKCYA